LLYRLSKEPLSGCKSSKGNNSGRQGSSSSWDREKERVHRENQGPHPQH